MIIVVGLSPPESFWKRVRMYNSEFTVRPGKSRVQRTLPAEILRKIGRLNHDNSIEFETSRIVGNGNSHFAIAFLPQMRITVPRSPSPSDARQR